MTSQHVLYKVEKNIATITMNRPEVHNAFNEEMIGELTNAGGAFGSVTAKLNAWVALAKALAATKTPE